MVFKFNLLLKQFSICFKKKPLFNAYPFNPEKIFKDQGFQK